jgi:hypothetical protein
MTQVFKCFWCLDKAVREGTVGNIMSLPKDGEILVDGTVLCMDHAVRLLAGRKAALSAE